MQSPEAVFVIRSANKQCTGFSLNVKVNIVRIPIIKVSWDVDKSWKGGLLSTAQSVCAWTYHCITGSKH